MARDNRAKIAEILMNSDNFISGEEISEKLGISRAAVWKHIKTLKENGYDIESVNKVGYRLKSINNSSFSPERFLSILDTEFIGRNIKCFDSLESTNKYVLENSENLEDGSVVIAEEQTGGRGRIGKPWKSKSGEGIWMSIVLKPEIPLNKAPFITLISGAALVDAFRNMDVDAKIKWPNDIILNGKKLCGILTEMKAQVERIECITTGVGINVLTEEFPEDIRKKATSLFIEGCLTDREKIASEFMKSFERMYKAYIEKDDRKEVLDTCTENSVLIGKEIRIIERGEEKYAICNGIDVDGNLIVTDENGHRKTIFSGEVSVRGKNGYI